jgi:hypothetical protein
MAHAWPGCAPAGRVAEPVAQEPPMADPRKSHQALADGRARLEEAASLLEGLAGRPDIAAGRAELAAALAAAGRHCGELVDLLAMEQRTALTVARASAQLALRRLDRALASNEGVDAGGMRTSLMTILTATDRLEHQIEALQAAAEGREPPRHEA